VTFVTNGTVQKVTAWRTNTAPDILFTAANMLTTTGTSIQDQPFTRTVTFIAPPATAGGAATTTTNAVPQVISPAMTVTLTDQGKLIINESPNFMQGSALYLLTFFQFGAFDGSTNPPIAFPQGTSIATLAAGYLAPPTGQGFATSPFNSILATNTAVGTGTTSGTVIGGSSIPTVFKSRPGGNSP